MRADAFPFGASKRIAASQPANVHAKGAALGQMLGVAVIYEADKHTFDDAAALLKKTRRRDKRSGAMVC